MLAAMSPVVEIAVVVLPVMASLGELLIRQWARARAERARQSAAWKTILVMEPGSLVVVQQSDGTGTVLVWAGGERGVEHRGDLGEPG
jgi:hypothetical protein